MEDGEADEDLLRVRRWRGGGGGGVGEYVSRNQTTDVSRQFVEEVKLF